MSVAEIKTESQKLTPSETLHLAAWFKALAQRDTPSRLSELDALSRDMENGQKMNSTEVRALLSQLDRAGA
jgi:hypothetical protein